MFRWLYSFVQFFGSSLYLPKSSFRPFIPSKNAILHTFKHSCISISFHNFVDNQVLHTTYMNFMSRFLLYIFIHIYYTYNFIHNMRMKLSHTLCTYKSRTHILFPFTTFKQVLTSLFYPIIFGSQTPHIIPPISHTYVR